MPRMIGNRPSVKFISLTGHILLTKLKSMIRMQTAKAAEMKKHIAKADDSSPCFEEQRNTLNDQHTHNEAGFHKQGDQYHTNMNLSKSQQMHISE